MKRFLGKVSLAVCIAAFIPVAGASEWMVGDVFVAIADSKYNVFDNNGNLKETITDGNPIPDLIPLSMPAGCAFNPSQSLLYTTNFSLNNVQVIDVSHPHTVVDSLATGEHGTGTGRQPESIVFRRDGSFLIGHAEGNRDVYEYSAARAFIQQFNVATEDRGSDWIELAADQQTLFYTSEGRMVLRFDVSGGGQLADFSSALNQSGRGFAMRLLPPYDGTGGLLVANWFDIKRLDGTGSVVQTYDVDGENLWFALNLDPNGTSFWVGDQVTTNIYRFNIASGAVEVGPILSGAPQLQLNGICVLGELGIFKDGFEDIDQPVVSVGVHSSTNEIDAPLPMSNTDCEVIRARLDAVGHSGGNTVCPPSDSQ